MIKFSKPPENSVEELKILIYGPSGEGKTTLGIYADEDPGDTVYIIAEHQAKSVLSEHERGSKLNIIDKVYDKHGKAYNVELFSHLTALFEELYVMKKEGLIDFKTIVVDSLSTIIENELNNMGVVFEKSKSNLEQNSLADYKDLKKIALKFLKRFAFYNTRIIYLSGVDERESIEIKRPLMSKGISKNIASTLNMVGYIRKSEASLDGSKREVLFLNTTGEDIILKKPAGLDNIETQYPMQWWDKIKKVGKINLLKEKKGE